MLGELRIDIRAERKVGKVSLEKVNLKDEAVIVTMMDEQHVALAVFLTKVETMCPSCGEENDKGIKIMILDNSCIIYECKKCNKLIWISCLMCQIDSGYQREYDRHVAWRKGFRERMKKNKR